MHVLPSFDVMITTSSLHLKQCHSVSNLPGAVFNDFTDKSLVIYCCTWEKIVVNFDPHPQLSNLVNIQKTLL